MDSLEQIKRAWWKFCNTNTPADVTVTFAESLTGRDAPRPLGTYLTLKIISGPVASGIDELRINDEDRFDICGLRQYTISIQGFRQGAADILTSLQALLDSTIDTLDLKESSGIAIVDRGAVTDITALLETGFEQRYSLDVVFNAAITQPTNLGTIESVIASGTIEGGKEGEQVVEEFQVDKP